MRRRFLYAALLAVALVGLWPVGAEAWWQGQVAMQFDQAREAVVMVAISGASTRRLTKSSLRVGCCLTFGGLRTARQGH